MKLLPWNIRGCSAPSKKRLLKKKIREEKPLVIFIQETKCSEESFKSIASKIWKNCEASTIDASSPAGGIGIIWNPLGLSITNFMATKFSISVEFHILGTNSKGFLTNVYGPFKLASKQLFLRSLQNMSNLVRQRHWIIGGIFNLIRNLQEKKGGIRTLNPTNNDFQNVTHGLTLSSTLSVHPAR